MPKSKRNRFVSLTATKKKSFSELKGRLVEEIRNCADKYERIFVFRVENMRNSKLKDLRNELPDSRFFFGKNKVMSIGLGRDKASEYKKNIHKLTKLLSGQCGLLFTNESKDEIFKFFDTHRDSDYARTGDIATETVKLYQGPLEQFPHNIEPYLRQLGMPTKLQKGIVTLLQDYQVCKKGQQLTSEQARILKLLGNQMAEFHVKIEAMWNNDGNFEVFSRKHSNKSTSESGDTDDDDDGGDQEDVETDEEMEAARMSKIYSLIALERPRNVDALSLGS